MSIHHIDFSHCLSRSPGIYRMPDPNFRHPQPERAACISDSNTRTRKLRKARKGLRASPTRTPRKPERAVHLRLHASPLSASQILCLWTGRSRPRCSTSPSSAAPPACWAWLACTVIGRPVQMTLGAASLGVEVDRVSKAPQGNERGAMGSENPPAC